MAYVLPTLDDLPSAGRNCGTCTRRGGQCARSEKNNKTIHNGYIRNSATGEISGMICGCPNWTGNE